MRIVVDTNTAISGLLWQGAPRRLLDVCRAGKVVIVTSQVLITELGEVLCRDKFAGRILRAGLSPREILEDYTHLTEEVEPKPLDGPVCRDPDDDEVLACAVTGKADMVVSGDADLLILRAFVTVQPPANVEGFRQSMQPDRRGWAARERGNPCAVAG